MTRKEKKSSSEEQRKDGLIPQKHGGALRARPPGPGPGRPKLEVPRRIARDASPDLLAKLIAIAGNDKHPEQMRAILAVLEFGWGATPPSPEALELMRAKVEALKARGPAQHNHLTINTSGMSPQEVLALMVQGAIVADPKLLDVKAEPEADTDSPSDDAEPTK